MIDLAQRRKLCKKYEIYLLTVDFTFATFSNPITSLTASIISYFIHSVISLSKISLIQYYNLSLLINTIRRSLYMIGKWRCLSGDILKYKD